MWYIKDLDMSRSSWMIQVDLETNDTRPYKRKQKETRIRQERGRYRCRGGRHWSDGSTTKER